MKVEIETHENKEPEITIRFETLKKSDVQTGGGANSYLMDWVTCLFETFSDAFPNSPLRILGIDSISNPDAELPRPDTDEPYSIQEDL